MYNTPPQNVEPGSLEPDERVPQEPPVRPKEKVSPSKQGQYLSALEKKEKEKEKLVKPEKKSEEDTVFHLAGKVKEKKPMKEPFGGETADTSKEGEEDLQEEDLSQKLPPTPQFAFGQVPAVPTPQVSADVPKTPALLRPYRTPKPPVTGRGPSLELAAGGAVAREPVARERVAFSTLLEKKAKEEDILSGIGKKDVAIAPDKSGAVPPPVSQMAQSTILTEATKEAPKSDRATFIELAQRMAETVETMVSNGKTTITVKLAQPPVFAGASITVVEDQTAKKQFNVTFTDLSPDARRLIESQGNQTQLRQTLIDRGYTLHMITIERPQPIVTSPVEGRPTSENPERDFEEGGERKGEEQKPF